MATNRILAQDIADQIMTMIMEDKRFHPGDRLPNENDFSKELHVSRNTLREAIRILSAYGLLDIRRGSGTFVTETAGQKSLETQMNPFAQLHLDVHDFRELNEMRLILEPAAAYLAALRGTDGEIRRIVALGHVVEQKIRNQEDRTEADKEFHAAIIQAAHNRYLEKMIPVLYHIIAQDISYGDQYIQPGEKTIADHLLVAEFLSRRNPTGARDAMRIHMQHGIAGSDLNL